MSILTNSIKYLATSCVMGRRFYAKKRIDAIPAGQDQIAFMLSRDVKVKLRAPDGKIALERGEFCDRVIVTTNIYPRRFFVEVVPLSKDRVQEIKLFMSPYDFDSTRGTPLSVFLGRASQSLKLSIGLNRLREPVVNWNFRCLTD